MKEVLEIESRIAITLYTVNQMIRINWKR